MPVDIMHCLRVDFAEKAGRVNNLIIGSAFSLCDLYGHVLSQEPPAEIYYFGRPFLGHNYYILSLSDL